jgi:histidinol dehydrogenase
VRAEWLECPAGEAVATAARVRAMSPPGGSVAAAVRAIVEAVRSRGDAAVLEHEARFGGGAAPLRVTPAELADALATLDADVRAGLDVARANVAAVATAGRGEDHEVALPQGQTVRLREIPVRRAAVYAPGGRAPYPSSVVMGAVTARAAGVDEVVVCAPAHPVILAACALCEVDEVYRMGGAQAIAALAYGTESVGRVDVIVGPGNLYVQEAKRQVSGDVGIDGFAGPSDLAVLCAGGAEPGLVALDLLAQAEHGEDTLVVAVAADARLLDDLAVEIGARLRDRPTVAQAACALVHAADLDTALEFCEALGPEHLELVGADAEALAPRVRSAGCLFVGGSGATAFGDYVAGSNHTLPTAGAARFASGLSVRHFTRRMSEVRIDAAAAGALAPHGAAIARAEGFLVHAESMEARAIGETVGDA